MGGCLACGWGVWLKVISKRMMAVPRPMAQPQWMGVSG
jgi:hypothetical protein